MESYARIAFYVTRQRGALTQWEGNAGAYPAPNRECAVCGHAGRHFMPIRNLSVAVAT